MYSKIAFRKYITLFISLGLLLSGVVTGEAKHENENPNRNWLSDQNEKRSINRVRSNNLPLLVPYPDITLNLRSTVSYDDASDDELTSNIDDLVKFAKTVVSVYSSVSGVYKAEVALEQALGIIEDNQKKSFDKIHEHLDQILGTLIKADIWNDQVDRRNALLADIDSIKRGTLTSDQDNEADRLVRNAGSDRASIRRYSEEANGKWKYFFKDRPDHPDGQSDLVVDWRVGVPQLMELIALRLTVIAAIDPKFKSDDLFDSELIAYRNDLLRHYNRMHGSVKCGWVYGDESSRTNFKLACADIYSGLAEYDVVSHFGEDVTYNELIKERDDKLANLRREVIRRMPFFEMRSMIDMLYLYYKGEPDLTEVQHKILSELTPHLCLDIKGSNPVAGAPVWLWSCDGSDGQKWVYDRKNDTIHNLVYDKYLDVQWGNWKPLTPIWVWDRNGTDAQRWTYDPEKHVLQNALGTVLDILDVNSGFHNRQIHLEDLVMTMWRDPDELLEWGGQRWYTDDVWLGHPPLYVPYQIADYVQFSLFDEVSSSSIGPGSYYFELIPPDQYDVPEGHAKGLPPGILLDHSSGKLFGLTQAEVGQQFDAHIFVINAQGENIAQIWVAIQVAKASDQAASLIGSLDTVNCGVISGQALENGQPRRVVSVDIYDENALLATVPANQPPNLPIPVANTPGFPVSNVQNVVNPDVVYHGFNYRIPDSLKDGKQHLISVKFSGTSVHLGHSPMSRSINPAPLIASQPVSATVCTGGPVTFSVTASGAGQTFQWRKNGIPIAGATSPSLAIGSASIGDAGSYNVVLFNGCSTLISEEASLTVNAAPAITSQPADAPTCQGQPATFSVIATGADLHYQWRKDGRPLTGETGSSLTIRSVRPNDTGSYDVIVSGSCGQSVISRKAPLTINSSISITSNPQSAGTCVGQPITFSVTATGTNLHYQWRKDGGNIPDQTNSSLTISSVSLGDAGSYSVVVYNGCDTETSGPATLKINNAIEITKQPVNVTKCQGQSVTFSVTATGTNLRYLWRKNGGNLPSETNSSLTISSVSPADAGAYSVVVYNGCSTMNSSAATLSVSNAPLSLSDMGQVFDASGGNGSVIVSGCGVWTAVSNVPWVTIQTGQSGNGGGTVTYSVTANVSNFLRSGVLTIAGKPYSISQQPAPLANNSQFVIQSLPTTMTAGQRYSVSIKMRNTGVSTWTSANGYRLVSQAPVNNLTWGLSEVPLPSSIAPGSEVTFNFTVTAPTAPGTYRFEWQVMQGQSGFGAFSPSIDIKVTQ